MVAFFSSTSFAIIRDRCIPVDRAVVALSPLLATLVSRPSQASPKAFQLLSTSRGSIFFGQSVKNPQFEALRRIYQRLFVPHNQYKVSRPLFSTACAMGRAVHLLKSGSPATAEFAIAEVPKPDLRSGQVLVRVTVRPVNPADVASVRGVYGGFQPAALPATPGTEGTGVIEAVGEGVTGFSVGQRVVPLLTGGGYTKVGNGSWQEYLAVDAKLLTVVPDGVPDEAAAQFVVNPFTAWLMLNEAAVPPEGFLLHNAATGALGRQLIQLAKLKGIKMISIVRRREAVEELVALGATRVICTDGERVPDRVKEITGGAGAWAALDCVAGSQTTALMASVRNGGSVIVYGAAEGLTANAGIGDIIFRGVTLKGFYLSQWVASHPFEQVKALVDEVWGLIASGQLVLTVGPKFDLADVQNALKESIKPGRCGKVLLVS